MYKIFFLITILVVGCSPERGKPQVTLNEKIGSMLLSVFRGDSPENAQHIADDITQKHIGGVVLFNSDPLIKGSHRNIKSPAQLKKLTSWLQGLSSHELCLY